MIEYKYQTEEDIKFWKDLPDIWYSTKKALPPIGREVQVFVPTAREHRKVTALCRLIPYEGCTIEYAWDNHYGGCNAHPKEFITHWKKMSIFEPETNET